MNERTFSPLNLSNNFATIQLDTGSNIIAVKYKGPVDTVLLFKQLYYLPSNLMNQYTYKMSMSADNASIGTKVYVNNQFVRQIKSVSESIPVLIGRNTLMLSKFGYEDSFITVESATEINISSKLVPHSYSSLIDSYTIDFSKNSKILYHKNVTLMDSSRKSAISIKQYDDSFSDLGLLPKSRKFEFRHLNSNWSNIRFAAVLDQIENLSEDSIYLMRVYDNTSFTKIPFDKSASYDSVVQKLTYNYINFNRGSATKEALVIMKKQAPIVNDAPELKMNRNDTLKIALSKFFSDPDSIQNDMTYEVNVSSFGISAKIVNNYLLLVPTRFWNGVASFTLRAQHDGVWRNTSASIKVESPNGPGLFAFPNPSNDLLNITGSEIENGKYGFEMKNATGQTMLTGTFDVQNNWVHKEISISELADGVYFLIFDNKKTKIAIRILKLN